MNDQLIEKLLRKGPTLRVPGDLLGKLRANIRLPRSTSSRVGFDTRASWLKRWLPALALASILLMCVVAIAVQTNLISELKRQNEALRAATVNLEPLRAANLEFQKLSAENQDLERLRKDNEELKTLQNQTARSGAQVQEIEKMKTENQQLRTRLAARRGVAGNSSIADAADAVAEAEAVNCVNNLKQLGLAFRLWSGDHEDRFPEDFLSMTNELNTWKILHCPSDKSRTVASWADVAAGNVSYRRVSSGPHAQEENPYVVLVQCPIHGHILLTDGAVQRGSPELQNHLRATNGVTVLVP